MLRANSRTPDVVIGDTRGQVGATRLGAARLTALADEYGRACVLGVMDEILERTARRLGAELSAWPDGEAEAEGFLDNDGAELDRPVRIAVRARKAGDRLTLDLGGCAPQTRGPVNVNAWTARSVSLLAVLAASDPTIPLNSGLLRAVDFVIPDGLVVNPRYPATINLYFPTSVMIYTCVLSALGRLNPARAVAPSGWSPARSSLGYRNRPRPLVQYELAATGLGGTSRHDGTPIVHPMNHFTAGSPVEVVETEYPVLVRRYDIWTDSAGAGRTRGGIGTVRELQVQEDCLLTLRSSGHRSAAWGLAGGEGPAVSRTTINPGTAGEQKLAAIDTRELKAGDVLRIERSGGAGCGPPRERDPEAVRRDVADGYVSREAARERYGVVIELRVSPRVAAPARPEDRLREMRDRRSRMSRRLSSGSPKADSGAPARLRGARGEPGGERVSRRSTHCHRRRISSAERPVGAYSVTASPLPSASWWSLRIVM